MSDKYSAYAALAAGEVRGTDFDIRVVDLGSRVAIIAPHGGLIEPGTSPIAETIAADTRSFYAFEGLRKRPHRALHITSSRFDEPSALALLAGAEVAVAIHGRVDEDDPDTIWVGGLALALRNAIIASLMAAGFRAEPALTRLTGLAPANICNRGTSGQGVQLEIPWCVRQNLRADKAAMLTFCTAVRAALPD